jgi:peptide subunit release factor 1 (eRF1)
VTGVFHDSVDRLLKFRPSGAPVLSLYVPIPYEPGELRGLEARFTSLLKSVREQLDSEEFDHGARESLRADIKGIADEVAPEASQFKGRAVAVFACHEARFFEQVVLPRPVRERAVVDATPYLRPLLAVLDECHRYCAVVVDREHAWIYEFFMGRLEESEKTHGRALRDPNYAGGWQGWKEDRTHHKAELLARRHYRKTAAAVDEVMRRTGAEFLIVGAHHETVAEFLPFLPHHLQPKVAGTFAVDPATMSPGQIRERADEVAAAYERREEQQLVAATLERLATGGFAAAGLDWCLLAVNEQAVQLLLIHDDEQAPGRVSDRCGWLGRDDDDCPVCGEPTRKTPDVIDEMAAAVVDAGGRVEHVYAETALDQHVVAAELRFPVPDPRAS